MLRLVQSQSAAFYYFAAIAMLPMVSVFKAVQRDAGGLFGKAEQ